ncbi:MAG: type I 3-dehydroquinate dehydratase [Treponema sp.]|jgi:3-dehydroquinate dehydratase/shikimate dehydrogenase|nr:type I 3-dehydroquinate dehydratase [Treponema sp.]
MSKICLCLTGNTIDQNLKVLEIYRSYADLVELRVDCLDPDERFLIRHFPSQAGLPAILTIRRTMDGGLFTGGEGSRISLFSRGLAFAETDQRRNFAYVDLEEDLTVPSLEEAARTFGTRIIRSYHSIQGGVEEGIAARLKSLRRTGNEIPKVAVKPESLKDTLRLYAAAEATADFDKIILGMGHYGVSTRILAEKMGSYISYASAIAGIADKLGDVSGGKRGENSLDESELPQGAPGQLNPRDLLELYRFKNISAKTRIFGIAGFPLKATSSPPFFNRVFTEEELDAVYVPFPAESLDVFLELANFLNIQGASITVPHKEEILKSLSSRSAEVQSVGACNTILRTPEGWAGYNTDTRGFSDSLLNFIDRTSLRGLKITIIGAGGAARAVAAEVFRLKGKALILNRTQIRARRLALPYNFKWGAADSAGADMMEKFSDIIIQTTSVGMEPDIDADPLEDYKFSGKETVMDIIYKPEMTRFLLRARQAGCRVLNGYDMLFRQAVYQYKIFTGKTFPARFLNRLNIKEFA